MRTHYQKLEDMYAAAPINDIYQPKLVVSAGESTIEIELSDKLHHAAGGVHGSVYFKMLDDDSDAAVRIAFDKRVPIGCSRRRTSGSKNTLGIDTNQKCRGTGSRSLKEAAT